MKNLPLGRPYLKPELILEEIEKVLQTRWISGGPAISRFETALKEYNGDPDRKYIAVSNGTTAIELALLMLNGGYNYKPDDEIITPSYSWVATGFSVPRVGAKPVWIDVDIFGVPTAKEIEKNISDKTVAIIVVHQMGIPCDMDAINDVANRYGIPIIEDAACAIGSEYKGKKIGAFTKNIVTYSFQARKVLTTGEGGMIVVSDEEDEKWLRSYRAFGTNSPPLDRDKTANINKEYFDKLGGNYKLSDIASAVGLAHLKYLDEEIELRTNAGYYYNTIIKEKNLDTLLGNQIPEYCTRYNWQNYHIILPPHYNRDLVVQKLKEKGIGCKWDIQAISSEPVISSSKVLPITEEFSNRGLWLPFYAEITKEDQTFVIDNLKDILNETKS